MADDGLINAYLRELSYSVATLRDADDIVAEAEDHLLEAVDRLARAGRSRPEAEAEAEAVARFGSASLVARVCMTESTRGAAVPTTRTRHAGLAALLAPLLIALGQGGNLTIEKGGAHGFAVFLLGLAFPAFVFGMWGLRARHGGLGRLGSVLLVPVVVLAVASLVILGPMGYAAIFTLLLVVNLSVFLFAVHMLRASVLPVTPLVLMAAGPLVALAQALVAAGVTIAGADAGGPPGLLLLSPVLISGAGFAWLGWHLLSEPAVNRHGADPSPLAPA